MIKTVLFCALFACAFATRDWPGLWSVVKKENSNTSFCDVPQTLSVVNISSDGQILKLEGLSAVTAKTTIWPLDWKANEQSASYCQEDGWCVTGSLIYNGIGIFANLTWNDSQDPSTSCSALLTPISLDWTGSWVVLTSTSHENCPAPIPETPVTIQAFGKEMLLIGQSAETRMIWDWPLNFTRTDLHVKHACIESLKLCASGNERLFNHYIVGNLKWLTDNTTACGVVMTKVPGISFEMLDDSDLSDFISNAPLF